MIYLIKFIYQSIILPPGSIIFLFFAACIFIKVKKKFVIRFIGLLTLVLYLVSIPLIGDRFIKTLEVQYVKPDTINSDVIVVLGGGATAGTPNIDFQGNVSNGSANRLILAAALYRKLQLPIIVSGGQVFKNSGAEAKIQKDTLISIGVPAEDIIIEDKSINTKQNAVNSSKIMISKGLKKPLLVTSAFHMKRAVKLFKKAGYEVIPFPADYRVSNNTSLSINDFIPSADSLENFSTALKEYIGLLQ